MNKEKVIENHRKMWNWLADETEKRKLKMNKTDYFEENRECRGIKLRNWCYLCEYTVNYTGIYSYSINCGVCPINWGSDSGYYMCENDGKGIYSQWCHCDPDDWQTAARLARKIANLPENMEV